MQVNAQDFLRLAERSHTLYFWDIESIGQAGDYGSVLVISVKPFGQEARVYQVEQLGNDRRVVREAAADLAGADAWVTYYGKGFDVPMVNTRLVKWGLPPLESRPHLDMYYTVKYRLRTGRRSQAHILRFLETEEEKMDVSPDMWAGLGSNFETNMKKLVRRCISDTVGLEALYNEIKPLVRDITR